MTTQTTVPIVQFKKREYRSYHFIKACGFDRIARETKDPIESLEWLIDKGFIRDPLMLAAKEMIRSDKMLLFHIYTP